MDRSVLVVSNRRPEDVGGRASKLSTRQRRLRDHGWHLEIGHVPEPYIRSFGPSMVHCYRRAKAVQPDVINSINNPFHLHLIGYVVSRLTATPWLAEYRDPMMTIPGRTPGQPSTVAANLTERLVVRSADRVVWFDGIQLDDDYFQTRYPDAPANRFEMLPPIGFDEEQFAAVSAQNADEFTIVYAGSFYEGWIEPIDFLEAVGTLVTNEGYPIRVHFYGDWNERYRRTVAERGLTDLVTVHGLVPFEEVLPALKGADVLLHIGGSDPRNAGNLPTKLYDYIGARSPILAIVDQGFRAASFIRDNGLGLVVPPGDIDAIHAALDRLRRGEFEYDPNPAVFEHTRARSVGAYVRVLEELIETG